MYSKYEIRFIIGGILVHYINESSMNSEDTKSESVDSLHSLLVTYNFLKQNIYESFNIVTGRGKNVANLKTSSSFKVCLHAQFKTADLASYK